MHVFYAPENTAATGEWKYQRLDDKAGMNSCVAVDLNADRKNDLVCGGASGVVRSYGTRVVDDAGPALSEVTNAKRW